MGAAIDRVLPRLEGVKQTAPGRWIARCPHHEDRSPSLSIREVDGRVLLYCFAGCRAVEVCGALGMGTRELFDDAKAWTIQPSKSKPPASDLLVAIDDDVHVVAVVGADILAGRQIGERDWDVLARAVRPINQAAGLVREYRPSCQ